MPVLSEPTGVEQLLLRAVRLVQEAAWAGLTMQVGLDGRWTLNVQLGEGRGMCSHRSSHWVLFGQSPLPPDQSWILARHKLPEVELQKDLGGRPTRPARQVTAGVEEALSHINAGLVGRWICPTDGSTEEQRQGAVQENTTEEQHRRPTHQTREGEQQKWQWHCEE